MNADDMIARGRGLFLFVPANKPDRFAKAAAARPDGVILDLEDALADTEKEAGREALARSWGDVHRSGVALLVRVNAIGTPWHELDIALARDLPFAALVLPKAEDPEAVARLSSTDGRGRVIAMVESAKGFSVARALAAVSTRLALGSFDYAADLGIAHTRETLLQVRAELVLASRLAGIAGPIDGVTTELDDLQLVEDDARYSRDLGFTGKLLIHPNQVAPAVRGFAPTAVEVDWAERVMTALRSTGVARVDGRMVDAPLRLKAERILQLAAGG